MPKIFSQFTSRISPDSPEFTHTNDAAVFGRHEFLSEDSEKRPDPKLQWPKDITRELFLEARIDQLSNLWVNKYRYESSNRAIAAGVELGILKRLKEVNQLDVVDDILVPIEEHLDIQREENGLVSATTPREDMDMLHSYYNCVDHALSNIIHNLGYQNTQWHELTYMQPPDESNL